MSNRTSCLLTSYVEFWWIVKLVNIPVFVMGASTIVTSSVERYLGADIISGWVPRCESGSGQGARLGLADDTETRRTGGSLNHYHHHGMRFPWPRSMGKDSQGATTGSNYTVVPLSPCLRSPLAPPHVLLNNAETHGGPPPSLLCTCTP